MSFLVLIHVRLVGAACNECSLGSGRCMAQHTRAPEIDVRSYVRIRDASLEVTEAYAVLALWRVLP